MPVVYLCTPDNIKKLQIFFFPGDLDNDIKCGKESHFVLLYNKGR